MKDLKRLLLLGLFLAATAACDQATKHFAMTTLAGGPDQSFLSDTVRLTYHENPGAFLGLGAQWRPELRATFFQFGNGLFLLATAVLALRSRFSRLGQAGLALFLAGGVSNLVDRMAMGRVIDFLNIGIGPLRTGVFNVADMAIIAGVAILIAEAVRNTYTPAMSNRQARSRRQAPGLPIAFPQPTDKRACNMQARMGMTFVSRLAAAAGISLVLTVLLMLLFQADGPAEPGEMLEASGGAASLSEPGIRPISLR